MFHIQYAITYDLQICYQNICYKIVSRIIANFECFTPLHATSRRFTPLHIFFNCFFRTNFWWYFINYFEYFERSFLIRSDLYFKNRNEIRNLKFERKILYLKNSKATAVRTIRSPTPIFVTLCSALKCVLSLSCTAYTCPTFISCFHGHLKKI